ncbi:MAG TPA: VOC family protein [Chloroflexota bacterium]|jgi:Glyoxalase-like domain|nr:VOC family protein [Chloroflexota bacterium]
MPSSFTELIVDAADPEGLSEFWCAVLDWQRTERYGGEAIEIAPPPGGLPTIVFVRSDELKHGKNRLHIDLNPRGCDQGTEVERLIGLGAQRVDIGQGQQAWIVLADPEGNEFCVLEERLDLP